MRKYLFEHRVCNAEAIVGCSGYWLLAKGYPVYALVAFVAALAAGIWADRLQGRL